MTKVLVLAIVFAALAALALGGWAVRAVRRPALA